MADASDSKSDVGDYVWVQVPSPAYKKDFIPNGMESFLYAERAGYGKRSGLFPGRKLIQQKFYFSETCSADCSGTGCILDISYRMRSVEKSLFDRSGSDTHTVTDYFFITHGIPSFRR